MSSGTVYVGTVGQSVWRSKDGGDSWQRTSNGMFAECEVRALAAHPQNPALLYAGTDRGCYRTEDGGNHWTHLDSPMNDLQIWSLAVDPEDAANIYAGTCPGALFRSQNGGESWEELSAEIARECPGIIYTRTTSIAIHPDYSSDIIAGIEIDGLRCSADGGDTWSVCNEGLTNMDIHGIAISPEDPQTIIVTTNSDVFKSTDGGQHWQALGVKSHFPWSYCRSIVLSPEAPHTLYVGAGNGPPGDVGGLFRSNDLGESWEQIPLGATPNSTIWCLAANVVDAKRLYASSVSGQVFRSTDGGAHWTKLEREFGEIRALAWVAA